MGFTDFLGKPIDTDRLEEKIMQYLPEGSYEITEKSEKDDASKDIARLPDISFLDLGYAVEHAGSTAAVLKLMKQFVAVAMSEKDELNGYLEAVKADPENKEAISDFRVKVHAMKTSASLCGALPAYGMAVRLELAAIEERTDEIEVLTPYFLDSWTMLYHDLTEYFDSSDKSKEPNQELKDEKLKSLLHQLLTAINTYDIKRADSIIEELDGFEVSPDKAEKIGRLKTAIAGLDAERCGTICKEILDE